METTIALAIFGIVGAAVLSGLSTANISGRETDIQSNSENIARNQMEYVFSLPYQEPPSSYPTVTVHQGYAVTCEAQEFTGGVPNTEKVVVTVSFGGTRQLVLETLRAK